MRETRLPVRILVAAGGLLTLGLAAPPRAAATPESCHRYRVIDVGTLGGTQSQLSNFDQLATTPSPFNNAGQLAVTALTSSGASEAALWSRGVLTALPNLP